MKFSYIICYRHNEERYSNLLRVLEWLNDFGNIEVIIVEQDIEEKLNIDNSKYNFEFKKYFTYSNLPFERAWAFNVGLTNSSNHIVVFGDSDLIMNKNEFLESIEKTSEFDCVSPYRSVLDLDPQESIYSIEEWIKIKRPGRGETDNQKINLTGGIVIYKKESILKIGGWDENFIGWGGEDDWQTRKTQMFLRFLEMPYRCYHLFHQRVNPDMRFYKRTIDILNQLFRLNHIQVINYINNNKNIGISNKYEK
jgi:hypothetical protein